MISLYFSDFAEESREKLAPSLASWIGNAQLSRPRVYICTLIYLRSCTGTDTSRDDTDVDVPQDVLLNPENGGIEARRPFSRAYLCAYEYTCVNLYVCNSTCRTRAIRGAGRVASMPRDGWSGPVVLIASKPPPTPSPPSRRCFSPCTNGRATYSTRDKRTLRIATCLIRNVYSSRYELCRTEINNFHFFAFQVSP